MPPAPKGWSYMASSRDYSPVRENEAPGPRRAPLYSDYAEDRTEREPGEWPWEERERQSEERRRREREEIAQQRELQQRRERAREEMALQRELQQRREHEERSQRLRAMESQQWERERGEERIQDLGLDDVYNDHRYEQTRRPFFIKKEVWYPNLRQSLLDSGLSFKETATSFVVYNATDEQVAQIKGDALEKAPAAPPFDGGEDDNESGSTSSDDEYDILHYSFKPDGEFEDENPPRVLNPGPHTWWFDVPLKSSGDESSPLKKIFHEVAITNGPGSSTYRRAFTMNRQQPESQKSIKCVTKRIISSRRSIRAEVKDDTIKLMAATANPSGRETSLDDLRFRWISCTSTADANDELLVTYSPSTLEDIAGPNIEIEDGKQDDGVTIRVGTTFDGAHYFPAEKCKTWFEFQAELKKVMRPSRYEHYKEKDAIITCKDGTILNSQNWAAKLGETRLKLFRLTLELKPRKMISAPSSRPLGLLHAPPPPSDAYSLVPYSGKQSRRPDFMKAQPFRLDQMDLSTRRSLGMEPSQGIPIAARRPAVRTTLRTRPNREILRIAGVVITVWGESTP
ncbi:hypothetical protein TWF192_008587 [Orbilia oligospora]|nr:hypothetical protein TWF192_008587 [Orbilia oligospora]